MLRGFVFGFVEFFEFVGFERSEVRHRKSDATHIADLRPLFSDIWFVEFIEFSEFIALVEVTACC